MKSAATTRVLVIDDLPTMRQTVSDMLQAEGFEVIEAANGREGIAKMREGPADLVITDVIMPEMEGVETVLALKREYPSLPIIAMSGGDRGTTYDFLGAVAKLGASITLRKPFTRQELLEAVERCLEAAAR